MSSDGDSVFDILGLDRSVVLPAPPADVWSAALAHALDPESPPVDDVVVPIMDDTDVGFDAQDVLLPDPDDDTDSDTAGHYDPSHDGLLDHGSSHLDGDDHHSHEHDGHGHEHDDGGHWDADDIDLGDGSDFGP
ncbi:hypothetical protein CH275_22210 [Rhodococcus sp. 06-235-1A]|uniref:hypothetical protein n=1 Tax=Rhodococcus sp. 06-235-1A TaxID=2022508 RepID=UPI000B9A1BA1|nr:hypothetical protein [Rhodococcus sp. 06-235-1A]OZC99221.1 hypothetical protein CH275_22210 [Rhodococcus sp. 06-235-1A]